MELSWALRGTTYGRGRDSDASGPWTFRVAGRAVGHIHSDERGDLPDMITIANLVAGDVRRGGPPLPALSHVSLTIDPGFFALLGPSGAGKSTLLRVLATLQPPDAGDATIAGHSVRGDRLGVRRLIGYVPQVANVFGSLSVLDNLKVLEGVPRRAQRITKMLEQFPAQAACRTVSACALSGGERQQLAFARAMMARPHMVLLDEPTAARSPNLMSQAFELIKTVPARSTAVLLVEQRARQALSISQRSYILDQGRVVMQGPAGELLADPRLVRLYLGG